MTFESEKYMRAQNIWENTFEQLLARGTLADQAITEANKAYDAFLDKVNGRDKQNC